MSTQIRRAPPPALLTLILLASVNVVTLNMFLPSLPDMAEDFGVSVGVMGWSFSGYLLVIAGMQLIVGPLSDYFGRRPVLIGCFLVYIPATLACMFAPTIEVFFLGRFFQGVVIAAVGMSHAIIRDTEPTAEHAASRLATVVMIMAIMPMLAPLAGGVLADLFGWRSNFLLMALFSLVTFALVFSTLAETNLNRAATFGRQIRSYPTLLAKRRFWGFALTIVCNVGAFYVFLVGMPIVGQASFELSRTEIGLLMALMPLGYMAGNSIVRVMAPRAGIEPLLMTGRLLGVGSVLLSLGALSLGIGNAFVIFAPLILIGLANGLIMPTSTSGAVSINPQLAGTASGLTGALGQSIGAALTAIGGAIMTAAPTPGVLLTIMLTIAAFGVLPALLLRGTASPEPVSAAD